VNNKKFNFRMPSDLLHFNYHLGKMRRSKHGIIDDIKGVGYFFLHVRNETKNQEAGLRTG